MHLAAAATSMTEQRCNNPNREQKNCYTHRGYTVTGRQTSTDWWRKDWNERRRWRWRWWWWGVCHRGPWRRHRPARVSTQSSSAVQLPVSTLVMMIDSADTVIQQTHQLIANNLQGAPKLSIILKDATQRPTFRIVYRQAQNSFLAIKHVYFYNFTFPR